MAYIIRISTAKMPINVKAPYKRIALIEVEPGIESVSMISERAKGVKRIVRTWERLHARGKNTAYARAMVEAQAELVALNAG